MYVFAQQIVQNRTFDSPVRNVSGVAPCVGYAEATRLSGVGQTLHTTEVRSDIQLSCFRQPFTRRLSGDRHGCDAADTPPAYAARKGGVFV